MDGSGAEFTNQSLTGNGQIIMIPHNSREAERFPRASSQGEVLLLHQGRISWKGVVTRTGTT